MLRPRVTAAQRKHLLDVRTGNHHKRLGGVMVVPGIKSIEEWEAEAVPQQTRLLAEARDELHGAREAHLKQQTEVKA